MKCIVFEILLNYIVFYEYIALRRYEGTVRPVTGIFASSGLLHEDGHGQNQLKPYIFTCESKFPSMVPFGISVTLGRQDGFIHVANTGKKFKYKIDFQKNLLEYSSDALCHAPFKLSKLSLS